MIDCDQFVTWREKNKDKIIKYKNTVHSLSAEDKSHIDNIETKLGYAKKKAK